MGSLLLFCLKNIAEKNNGRKLISVYFQFYFNFLERSVMESKILQNLK